MPILGCIAHLLFQFALGQVPPETIASSTAHERTALLYSDQLTILPDGEPMVRIGVGTNQLQVQLRVMHHTARITFTDPTNTVHSQILHAQQIVTVHVADYQPAEKRYYVDLGSVDHNNPHLLQARLASWRAAGLTSVTTLENGTLIGTRQRTLDTRTTHLIIWASDHHEATRILARTRQRGATQAAIRWRLGTLPTATLHIHVDGAFLAIAQDSMHVVPLNHNGHVDLNGLTAVLGNASAPGASSGTTPMATPTYHGEIDVVVDSLGQLTTVNTVGIETILKGVVPAEIFASAAPEALKAQAIAARNTLLASVGHRHHTDPFHLCNTQHCQMYSGHHSEDVRTTHAIRATRGHVLFLGDQLVNAVYSSTCGGHTEDNDVVWSEAPNPALRGRPDYPTNTDPSPSPWHLSDAAQFRPYCARASFADPKRVFWHQVIPIHKIQHTVDATYPHVGNVMALQPGATGPGGRLHTLTIVGDQGNATIERELPIRQWLSHLRSAAMTIHTTYNADNTINGFSFDGVGWGHGVGMCQMGAIGRAEAGHSHHAILSHYYNGAQVKLLY